MSVEAKNSSHSETAGSKLRAARIAKSLDVATVATALRIRKTQIEAIENNDLDALPGMTYAVGFVKSYANYVGLNSTDIARQFKADNSYSANASNLSFPAPLNENRMPEPMLVGIGAFLAIVLLVGWMIYAGVSGDDDASDSIQPPPIAASENQTAPSEAATDGETPAAVADIPPPPADILPTAEAPPVTPTSEAPPALALPAAPAAETKTPEPALAAGTEKAEAKKPAEETKKPEAPKEAVADNKKKDEGAINIKRSKSRIVLRANQSSWVQITDYRQGVIFKKVLRPGEEYAVPEQTGLSLITSNAGGLDIIVDGQKAPSLGSPGEILRGIPLDPADLKVKKTRTRYN